MDRTELMALVLQAKQHLEQRVALKKAEPGTDDEDKNPVGGGDDKSPPAKEEPEASAAESSPGEAPHEGSAGPDVSPEGSPADMAAAQDPAAQQAVDPQQLQAEYAALPLDELKMHVSAAQAALAILVGGAQSPMAASPAPMPQSAPASPAMSAPPVSGGAPDMAVALKSELASQFETFKKSLALNLTEQVKQVQATAAAAVAAAKQEAEASAKKLRETEEALRKSHSAQRSTVASLPLTNAVSKRVQALDGVEAAKQVVEKFRKSNGNDPLWKNRNNAALAAEAVEKHTIEFDRVAHLLK